MDLSLHYEELTEALLFAFRSAGELRILTQFELDVPMQTVVGPGPLRQQVFDLIEWADSENKVDRLFAGALKRKPNSPLLKKLAAKLRSEVIASHNKLADQTEALLNKEYENPHADQLRSKLEQFSTSGMLEALVVGVPNLGIGQDAIKFMMILHESTRRICSVGTADGHIGTGFLVGLDRVITNWHVVKETPINQLNVVFDFPGNEIKPRPAGIAVAEVLAQSPEREFDYAILKLPQSPGRERGYFRVRSRILNQVREPVSVLGHSFGNPAVFSFGVIMDNNSFMGRVAYTANTGPGGSGSPVFAENWDLIALHHHGETNVNNHGIPMFHIVDHLGPKAVALLEKANP